MANTTVGSLIWELGVDKQAFESALASASAKAKSTASSIDKGFSQAAKNISSSLNSIGDDLIKFGAAGTATLGLVTTSAVSWEDSLADVRKATGLTTEETAKLGKEILNLGKSTRSSNRELLEIGRIGGQLGVNNKVIYEFIEAVDQANVALGDEFSGGVEEITRQLGTLATQFKLTGEDGEAIATSITQIGSAINSLGASGLATGPYITDFGRRVGGVAPLVGLSIDKVLGLGAALQELGQSQEVAGTSIQQILLKMGANISDFAKLAGVSTREFSKLLKEDVNEALLLVATGIAKDSESIEDLAKKFDGLGIDGQRAIAVLANLGNNVDLVRQRQELASEAFIDGTSILDEYNIKNETAAANMAKFRNDIEGIGITLGTTLLPKINETLERVTPFVDKFGKFVEDNPKLIAGILGTATALTTLGLALKVIAVSLGGITSIVNVASVAFVGLGNVASLSLGLGFVKNVSDAVAAFQLLGGAVKVAMLGATKAVWGFTVALLANPITWIVLAIVGLVALLYFAWTNNWGGIQEKTKAAWEFIKGFWEWLKTGFINFFTKTLPESLTAIGDGIKTFFTETLPTAVTNGVNAVVEFILGFPELLRSALWQGFLFVVTGIGFVLGLILFTLIAIFTAMWNWLSTNVPLMIQSVVTFFSELPAKIWGALVWTWEQIKSVWTSIGNWLNENVPLIIDSIINFFSQLPDRVWQNLVWVWDRVKEAWTSIRQSTTELVSNMIESVVKFFSELPSKVWTWLVELTDKVALGIGNTWTAILDEISTWPSRLFDWGKKLVESLANGIKDAMWQVVEAFKEGFNKARKYVEGKSPPVAGPFKDIDKWGFNVGMAWVDGMKDAMSMLSTDSMYRMGEFDRQFELANSTPSSSVTLNVNIGTYAGSEMEKRELAKQLYDALQDYNKGIGADI